MSASSPLSLRRTVLAACLVASGSAANLTCRFGAIDQDYKACGTISTGTPPFDASPCDDTTHSCLTARWAGDWFAAYGCYPNEVIEDTKDYFEAQCLLIDLCRDNNADGKPVEWQVCTTDLCNTCNGAHNSAVASLTVLAGAAITAVLTATVR